MKKLSDFLGIDDERYMNKINPLMNGLIGKGGKVDIALMVIENNKELTVIEKIYCAYEIGRVIGGSDTGRISQVKSEINKLIRGG
jgi:hypothetical protein